MKTNSRFLRVALACALALHLTGLTAAWGQTDDFDSYASVSGFTNAGWVLSKTSNGVVTTTFPATGSGKGLQIQAKPVLGVAPAVAIWYRTTLLKNFFLAADVVNWADTNQAIALLARGSISGEPDSASGYLVNYNVTHWGDTPTSPRQGELQISRLSAPFSTTQLAMGELTLEPGRPYRFVFSGVGFHFTVQVYDLHDLTQPLIQMEADDLGHTYTNGVCGLMSFSRGDEPYVATTDVTLDNYEIGEFDSNSATPPARAHPVPGTPTIEARIPVARFTNCYDPSGGISFRASTYTTNVINASATKLRLNGVDVSSQLVLSTNGPNISGRLPDTALSSYAVYSAQIEVQDVAGHKRSTNTFWFDTFSQAYLASAEVKTIEAENYNYSNGVYQLDPVAVSGLDRDGTAIGGGGVGYFNLHGVEGVDFHDRLTVAEPLWAGEFRSFDPVGLAQGMYPEIEDAIDPWGETRYSDQVRNQYATNNMLEYVVHRTEPGEWLNYTRDFNAGNYRVFLRVAALGSTTVLLDRIISNPRLPTQTKVNLGKFLIPNQFARYNYHYVPLVNNSGSPLVLNLEGTATLRLTLAGTPGQDNHKLAINYLLLLPVVDSIRVWSSPTAGGFYTEEVAARVDTGKRTVTVSTTGLTRYYRLSAEVALTIRNFSVSGSSVTMQY